MILSKKLENAINKQINAELWSAYLYLSMSAYFESMNLGGFATWMKVQAQEEVDHAMKFYTHIIERRGRVMVSAINAVPTNWIQVPLPHLCGKPRLIRSLEKLHI